jgi:hypothetical protein
MGTVFTNDSTRPIRRILVRFEAAKGGGSLTAAADLAARERATIDLCGLVQRRSAMLCLALLGGVPVMPDQLVAEELEEMAEKMRLAVAELPQDLGIRSFLLVGNPRRKIAELVAQGNYDLVV